MTENSLVKTPSKPRLCLNDHCASLIRALIEKPVPPGILCEWVSRSHLPMTFSYLAGGLDKNV
jgi:hypothetical protein